MRHVSIVRLLLEARAKSLDVPNSDGITPLLSATETKSYVYIYIYIYIYMYIYIYIYIFIHIYIYI